MYKRFREFLNNYYQDTLIDIFMVPAFNVMELEGALFFEISQEVEFQTKEVKEHGKTKALAETLSVKFNQLAKENQ